MILSSPDYRLEGDSRVVSPKTLTARERVSLILVRHSCGHLTLSEAEHELWRVVNGLTDNYDEGYTAGFRAAEEKEMEKEQKKREPKYPEL